jgi:hypothetical protein
MCLIALITILWVQISSFMSTMSIHQWKEFNVVKGSACSCFHPTWMSTSRAMVAKVWWTSSWVLVHSLPRVQRKRWIPLRLMGCMHTHQGRPAIEGCDSPSCVWSNVEKTKKDHWKDKKTYQGISQIPPPRLDHDKIQAW